MKSKLNGYRVPGTAFFSGTWYPVSGIRLPFSVFRYP